ncbi:MAG TPA: response regulator transcription factor [Flavipsychrobacter sp.]
MKKNVSIFLVDDHTIVRNGIKELIERIGDYEVIAQFDNGQELIDAIDNGEKADIIIMDLAMPVMDGKEAARQLRDRNTDIPVLILTIDSTEKTIIELFKLGVRGYLPKNCTAEVLRKAIDDIMNTGYYHNDLLIKALQSDEKGGARRNDEKQKVLKLITERERVFLELVCSEEEYTYEQMADILKVHRRTIDGYRESLFDKFNIKSKTGLVLFAIKYGLVEIPLKY